MSEQRYAVDRIEEGLAVLIPDKDGLEPLYLSAVEYGLRVNDIVDITEDDGNIVSLKMRDDIREERISSVKSRLQGLFKRGKKQ